MTNEFFAYCNMCEIMNVYFMHVHGHNFVCKRKRLVG